jgi:hypothetical protein
MEFSLVFILSISLYIFSDSYMCATWCTHISLLYNIYQNVIIQKNHVYKTTQMDYEIKHKIVIKYFVSLPKRTDIIQQ